MNTKYDTFEEALNTDLIVSVSTVSEAADARLLSQPQIEMLFESLRAAYPATFSTPGSNLGTASPDPGYGADFDLAEEVNAQIRVVRSLRNMIVDPETGAIREGHSARDAKELIGSGNTMLASLMKFHDKIINQDRVRAMEQATIEAVKDLPQPAQDKFFNKLEDALAAIK